MEQRLLEALFQHLVLFVTEYSLETQSLWAQ